MDTEKYEALQREVESLTRRLDALSAKPVAARAPVSTNPTFNIEDIKPGMSAEKKAEIFKESCRLLGR